MCTHVHVRQSWTKRRKMKEGRKKGYILETKGIPIRKEKRLGTKEGTNGELVPRKPVRFTHLQAPLIGTAIPWHRTEHILPPVTLDRRHLRCGFAML